MYKSESRARLRTRHSGGAGKTQIARRARATDPMAPPHARACRVARVRIPCAPLAHAPLVASHTSLSYPTRTDTLTGSRPSPRLLPSPGDRCRLLTILCNSKLNHTRVHALPLPRPLSHPLPRQHTTRMCMCMCMWCGCAHGGRYRRPRPEARLRRARSAPRPPPPARRVMF